LAVSSCPCLRLSSFQTDNEDFNLILSCEYDACKVRGRQ